MAEDYRVAADFIGHPKTVRMMSRLGSDGVVWLLGLWGWARSYRPKGILTGMNEEDIRIAAKAPEGSEFVAVLIECGFIDRLGNGRYRLHGWQKRNGFAYHEEKRVAAAKKAATSRWHKRHNDLTDADRSAETCEAHAICDAPSPTPIPLPSPSHSTARQFLTWWGTEWQKRFGSTYSCQFAKDTNLVKQMLKTLKDDVGELQKRALRYLNDQDDFLRKGGYTIGIFKTRFNSYADGVYAKRESGGAVPFNAAGGIAPPEGKYDGI